jgi:hypothetical protein
MTTTNIKTVKPSGGDYTSLSNWEAGRQGDLVSLDTIEIADCYSMSDTAAVIFDGWTTGASNYIQAQGATSDKTPTNTGIYSTSRYRLENTTGTSISMLEDYVRLDGLQIYPQDISNGTDGIYGNTFVGYYLISNCIIRGIVVDHIRAGISLDVPDASKIWNCLIYDWKMATPGFSQYEVGIVFAPSFTCTGYIYNCTIVNCGRGIQTNSPDERVIAINNILYLNEVPADGIFKTGTDYNATDAASISYTVTGNTHDRVLQILSFVSSSDFHLQYTDTGARGHGLSDPGSGLFSTDLNGYTRPVAWDIGAEQSPTVNVKTVKPSSGDYSSLSNWEAGRQGDLVSLNTIEIAACYAMSDTASVVLNGWATGVNNFIKIYTPASERHSGVWDDSKYKCVYSGTALDDNHFLDVDTEYVWVDGLQFDYENNNYSNGAAIIILNSNVTSQLIKISNCIFKRITYASRSAVEMNSNYSRLTIWNCVFYNYNDVAAIYDNASSFAVANIYNCTFSNCAKGVSRGSATVTTENSLFYNCTLDASGGIGDAYCATSNDNTKGLTAAGTGNRFSQTFSFVNVVGNNYLLFYNDTGAKGYGITNPGSGLFSDDISGHVRAVPWDIGASQAGTSLNFYKTYLGLPRLMIKTWNGIPVEYVKTWNSLS